MEKCYRCKQKPAETDEYNMLYLKDNCLSDVADGNDCVCLCEDCLRDIKEIVECWLQNHEIEIKPKL